MKALWNAFNVSNCLSEVPECEFFKEIKAKAMHRKCCVEHMKMKQSLFHTIDVAERYGLKIFLDSGTLLSAMRDGGDTLLPWETDIDLGVIGVRPEIVSGPFKDYWDEVKAAKKGEALKDHDARKGSLRLPTRKHLFKECKLKVSKNVSRNGMCMDAHYVYYATTESEASQDTSRVEIWPFWPEPGLLVHPTRKRLSVPPSMVEPMWYGGKCRMWGRPMWCPHDSVGYLDHEYGKDSWRLPKTIHWGKSNVPTWRTAEPSG